MSNLASMSIGSEISRVRKERGFSQLDLAGKVGITQQQLSNYETNTRSPSKGKLQKIADALGCEWRLLDKPV